MYGSRRDQYIHWALGAIAGISIGMSILDVIGIAPGWAARLTPFFVGVLLLYVVLERERVDSIKYIVRRLDKGIDKLRTDMRRIGSSGAGEARGESFRALPWKNMLFRSNTEIRIAKALDHAGLFFLSPSTARVTSGRGRETRELDFLVFHEGRWGVLEVDGPYHHAEADSARDALLRAHGLQFIARFDAEQCYHHPDEVVQAFVRQMREHGASIADTRANGA
jgi:hypothetical protein